MKKANKLLALVLCLSVILSLSAVTASAEVTVEHDFLAITTISNKNGGETEGRVEQEGRDPETGDGGGAFLSRPKTSLDVGGRVICYMRSKAYDSSWLLEYDIELTGDEGETSMVFSVCTWGEHRFANGNSSFQIAEKVCAVAGVEPLWQENDQGGKDAVLPAGHYKGIIDVSEYIEDGFDNFSHLGIYWSGKSVAVNTFRFVSGAEPSPVVTTTTQTTTTTEAPTTTTENTDDVTTTTGAVAGDNADTAEDSGLPVGVVIAIVAAAVVVLGGGAVAVIFLLKKKK